MSTGVLPPSEHLSMRAPMPPNQRHPMFAYILATSLGTLGILHLSHGRSRGMGAGEFAIAAFLVGFTGIATHRNWFGWSNPPCGGGVSR